MKKLSNLIVFLGILVIFSPFIVKKYADFRSQQILESLENEMKAMEEVDYILNEHSEEYISVNNPVVQEGIMEEAVPLKSEENNIQTQETNSSSEEFKNNNTIIKISKINLKLPVFSGVTEKNLKYGVASFRKDVSPGGLGNYSLAGHRSYTYGRMFNRLDELQEGDSIEIIQDNKKFIYKVINTFIVNPEDTWVLKSEKGKKTITLVTCHPIRIANQRLIVMGELVED